MFFVHPSHQSRVREKLGKLIYVPFKFEPSGSQIILFNQEEDYSDEDKARTTQAAQISQGLSYIEDYEVASRDAS